MTAGERRLAERLESHLEDDYLLWYDVPIGDKYLHPDFIVLHPGRGIFILEVKDWKIENIFQATRTSFSLQTENSQNKEVKNPLLQARDYTFAVKKLLEQDPALVQIEGPYKGNLCFPYGYGVVLSNITRRAFETSGLQEVIEPHLVICKDEMYESVDPLHLQERIWNFTAYQFGMILTSEQIDRIRWHLFPELRISVQQLSLFEEKSSSTGNKASQIPDLIRIMDLQQEQLARSLGEGHRVIHGVAGSGKTLILAYRCQYLAQLFRKPILILCFNVALAARLRQIVQEKGLTSQIIISHFHGWCKEQLRMYRIPRPDYKQYSGAAYVEQLVHQVIQSVDQGRIPAGMYGAVLIDEGHDFKPEWLKLLTQMVDPKTNALLVLYDDAQNLYGEAKKQKFSFKSIGIQAQGRTTILKINYRNTTEVLTLAYEFAKEVMLPTDTEEEDVPMLLKPQSAGRHGPLPELVRLPSFRQETEYLVQRAQQLYERGVSWKEMAIAYRSAFMGQSIYSKLQQAQIPVEWVNQNQDSRHYHPEAESIKLITMHSSKGLEFPVVFIPGIGYLPNQYSTPEEEARLLYVAMTRAIDQLIMTCDRDSEFVKKIQVSRDKVAETAA
jgi:UvrD-like helicase C-terminal domain/Nuclease-related domain/AAA domain